VPRLALYSSISSFAKRSFFRYGRILPCCPMEVNKHFGGMRCYHFQGWKPVKKPGWARQQASLFLLLNISANKNINNKWISELRRHVKSANWSRLLMTVRFVDVPHVEQPSLRFMNRKVKSRAFSLLLSSISSSIIVCCCTAGHRQVSKSLAFQKVVLCTRCPRI
jgi:hypothetical protein